MSSEPLAVTHPIPVPRERVVTAPLYRIGLGAILLLSAVLNFLSLSRIGLGNTYYAAAVKSMMQNWHNFFFNSFDPGGFVTIDKPPVAFWLQTASAKLFGFNGISLLLPEAVAGVLSVLVLYYLVARIFGRPAGLLAALALAITPVLVVVNRSNLVESILVLTLLLAAWATLKAIETGKLGWVLLGAALVGVGYNVKMLEAYLIVPALFLAYLVGAHVTWPRRIGNLVLAAVVLLGVSLSWTEAVDLTPASQRPYVASSGDNSELNLALGYNGLGRLTGNTFGFLSGRSSVSGALSDLTPTNLGFTQGENGAPGVQRLVNAELGGQTGWLLLLAIIGFLVAAWQTRPRRPLDIRHSSLVLWGGWLLTGGVFFSIAGMFHSYYLATIAPPIAALAGIGVATLWSDYRRPGLRGWALPIALVLSALLEAHVLGFYPAWSRWMTPLVVGGSVVLAALLAILRLREGRARLALAAAALGVGALLLPPALWSEYTVAHASGGMVVSAGPGGNGGRFGGGFGRGRFGRGGYGRGGFFGGQPGAAPGGLDVVGGGFPGGPPGGPFGPPAGFARGGGFGRDGGTVSTQLVRYLEAHGGRATFLVATLNAMEAEPFILQTGKPVMDLGGFMGGDKILTAAQLAARVRQGQVRYFLIGGRGGIRRVPADLPKQVREVLERRGFGGFGGGFAAGANDDLVTWVTRHCSTVPASAYGGSSTPAAGDDFGGAQPLYDCAAASAG